MSGYKYSFQMAQGSRRHNMKGHLIEDGAQVASVRRDQNAVYHIKWFTLGAEARFRDFCDCVSVEEGIEALMLRRMMYDV